MDIRTQHGWRLVVAIIAWGILIAVAINLVGFYPLGSPIGVAAMIGLGALRLALENNAIHQR